MRLKTLCAGALSLLCMASLAVAIGGSETADGFVGPRIPSADIVRLRPVGQYGGLSHAVAGSGDLLIAGAGPRIEVWRRAAPDRLDRVSEGPILDGLVTDIALTGRHALVADRYALSVFDLSLPPAPRRVARVLEDVGAERVAVSGQYAYVTTYAGLSVMDIARPESPRRVSWTNLQDLTFWPHGLAIAGSLLCLVGEGGFKLLDLSEPAAPRVIGGSRLAQNRSGETVAVGGGYAFVGTDGGPDDGLHVFDIRRPEAPREVGGWMRDTQPFITSLVFLGDRLLVGDQNGVHMLDVSDPTTPSAVGPALASQCEDLALDGSRLYVAVGPSVALYDLSDLAIPPAVPSATWTGYPFLLAAAGHHAYIGDHLASEIEIVDVADPAHPRHAGNWHHPGDSVYITDVAATGEIALIATWYESDGHEALTVVDMSDPARPRDLRTFEYDERSQSALRLAVGGGYAFAVGDSAGGLRVIDVSSPVAPRELGRLAGLSGNVTYSNHRLLVRGEDKLHIVDVTDAARPVQVGLWAGDYRAASLADDRIYVADDENWLHVYDIAQPEAPRRLGGLPLVLGPYFSLVADGDLVYVTDNSDELRVIDASNPAGPYDAGGWTAPDYHALRLLAADTLYAANVEGGLFILGRAAPERAYLPAAMAGE